MNKKTLNKILTYFREEMTAANSPGTQGGFSSSADAKGPVAGYDKPMKAKNRNIWTRGIRKIWMKKSES